ncbi:hypothetical protein [Mesorhizobium muleiense]|uniref:hypothetical protein n=1 Tax=Mesorhizobium muleiense TaxID=1004279 RepID=UPI001F3F3D9A|nr:hypothetical protein [Mesorhizobium muleiense]MCF6111606.1 hypothetical protein [Mesorhizobium muleiense]
MLPLFPRTGVPMPILDTPRSNLDTPHPNLDMPHPNPDMQMTGGGLPVRMTTDKNGSR